MTACPPQEDLECASRSPVEVLTGIAAAFMQGIAARRQITRQIPPLDAATLAEGAFAPVLATLAGLPAATNVKAAVDGALASIVLSRPAKALMFAVVARALDCPSSEVEARKVLKGADMSDAEIDAALARLHCHVRAARPRCHGDHPERLFPPHDPGHNPSPRPGHRVGR